MKTLRINLCLLLVLAAQVLAQRFTAGVVDSIYTGFADTRQNYGYFPNGKQIALLGKTNSSYANLMLVGGPQYKSSYMMYFYRVLNSYGEAFGNVNPVTSILYTLLYTSSGKRVYDSNMGAALVLDSLDDSKKNAIVLFSTIASLYVTKITIDETINDTNKVSDSLIIRIGTYNSSALAAELDSSQGGDMRLALLGISQNGSAKTYHIAVGNPNSKNGTIANSGRVDFYSLKKEANGTWTSLQPNTQGLVSGINGISLEAGARFGTDLTPIMDKSGKNALAVLLPQSPQYPQSAIHIFSMDNEWTPSKKPPVVITGSSMPWVEPGQEQNCNGLSVANWEKSHLLVSCDISKPSVSKGIMIKDIVLGSNFEILNSHTFFSKTIPDRSAKDYSTRANPLPIKNHKSNSNAVSIVTNGPVSLGSSGSILILPVMDADYSKNYSIGAGSQEMVVKLDSLFYKSGISGFSAKTLSGLVQCEVQNNNLLCEGKENAIGSWSTLELSSKSDCSPYRECKRKDTVFIYVRSQKENPNTALRIPRDIVIPFFGQKTFNDLKSLSHFKNPNSQKTDIAWDAKDLKWSEATSDKPNELSIISLSRKEGIDTLVFKLSIASNTDKYPVRLHFADSSKILNNGIPENPSDNDTVWNTSQKRYIALPSSNSNGNIYTYDIAQNGLKNYAEIAGDYLHVLKVEVVDISIAYTENSRIKNRKITLMPESSNLPSRIIISSTMQNFKAMRVNGGLQINSLNGEFEIKAYNFKGAEIQRKRAYAQGSTFVKLEHNCPQIVQIKSGNQKAYVKIVN
ncbi:MAG: hypothetical protein LBC64_04770 [Fibromonadaceae bacterium]|jgi:hypothetical protein|nr:hypothetical protein [Fibromonadaceae bacterium]